MNLTLIIIAFIMGTLFCLTQKSDSFYEPFNTNSCPNMLVRKGNNKSTRSKSYNI